MKPEEILEMIISGLVLNPQKVKIEKKITEMGTLLTIYCPKEERKFIIGRKGSTFKSLCSLMRKIGLKNRQLIHLKIHEEENEKNE